MNRYPSNLSPQLDKPRTLRWSTIAPYLCQRFPEGRTCSYQLSATNNAAHEGDHCITGFACGKIGNRTGIQIDTTDERVPTLCLGHPAFRIEIRVGLICREGTSNGRLRTMLRAVPWPRVGQRCQSPP